jgi:hypothetical protein
MPHRRRNRQQWMGRYLHRFHILSDVYTRSPPASGKGLSGSNCSSWGDAGSPIWWCSDRQRMPAQWANGFVQFFSDNFLTGSTSLRTILCDTSEFTGLQFYLHNWQNETPIQRSVYAKQLENPNRNCTRKSQMVENCLWNILIQEKATINHGNYQI